MKWQIINAHLFSHSAGFGLVLGDGRIERILPDRQGLPDLLSLDLHGMLILPGLINGHDSLMASYHPVEPIHFPYRNWLSYDNEVKASQVFEERMALDLKQLYALGGYKNIIAGATTVVDHIPDFVRRPYADYSLAHVLPDYGISHSVGSYSLDWGDGHRREYEYARERDLPFILHIAEGFDKESRESLRALDDIGALGEHTVLVHGISLDKADLDLIAKRGAHLVWCPKSNLRIYGKTLDVRSALERGILVSLGTDSAMTGSTDLLSEIRAARDYYQNEYEEELPSDVIVQMVTSHPRTSFRIRDRGAWDEGQVADLVVFQGSTSEPSRILSEATLADVFLVVRNGQPVYGDESLTEIFDFFELPYVRVRLGESRKIIVSEYLELITEIKKGSQSYRPFPFLPLEVVL